MCLLNMFTNLHNEQIEDYMMKTIHPLLSHNSSKKWGEGRGGAYSRRGAYFKFLPIGEEGRLFEGGGGG